jgi:hypothetical protein
VIYCIYWPGRRSYCLPGCHSVEHGSKKFLLDFYIITAVARQRIRTIRNAPCLATRQVDDWYDERVEN